MLEQPRIKTRLSRPPPSVFGMDRSVTTMAITAAMLLALMVPSRATAQLQNLDFENAPQTLGLTVINGGSFVDAPLNTWKVTTGSIEIGTAPAGTSCHAGHCVDLNGQAPGGITQSLSRVTPGAVCTVGFFMSRHVSLRSATMNTFANNSPTSPASFVHNTAGVTTTNGKWEYKSFTFTATGSDQIAFITGMAGAAGPQIDDVSISCVSEPPPPPPTEKPNPCCPPWNSTALAAHMFYQGVGGIGGNYTLKFTPSALLNTQMTAYMAYANAMVPSATSISIDFSLVNAGGTTMQTGSAKWGTSGSATLTPSSFFTAAMQTNQWYTIRTSIHLNGGTFFSDECGRAEISVRIQVQGMPVNNSERRVLQFRMPDGSTFERAVPNEK